MSHRESMAPMHQSLRHLGSWRAVTVSPATVIVGILLGEQVLTAIIGIAGGLWPAQSALLLHLLIAGQLLLDGLGLLLLFQSSGHQVARPRLLVVSLIGLLLAAVAKNLHVSPSAAAIDLVRLVVPLAWMALAPLGSIADEFLEQVGRIRYLIVAILVVQVVGLIGGRMEGWGAAYLSGDPLTGLLVFPAMVAGGDTIGQAAIVLMAVPVLVVSLKRTSWVSTAVVIVLLAVWSWRSASARALKRLSVVAICGLLLASAVAYRLGAANGVIRRAETITSIAANSGSDYSFAQRIQEITVEVNRIKANPIPTVLFGLSSEEVTLPNGQNTHAIHATPFFLLFGGGLLWVVAFLMAGIPRAIPHPEASPSLWLLALIAIGSLLDSLGGNTALAPSFGLALAVTSQLAALLLRKARTVERS